MNEALFQFIWKHRLFDAQSLKTTSQQAISILHTGNLNTNAGPDFLEAKIKIDQTTWAGNVELHLKASDWKKHHHVGNKNYEKIILHVVFENDLELNLDCPTLELKKNIDASLIKNYASLMQNNYFIPCEKLIEKVPVISKMQQLDKALLERLMQKSQSINELLILYKNSWQDVFYILLAQSFGLKINSFPFETLAKRIPLKLFSKHKNNLLQIEALLFGTAGFLTDDFNDVYYQTLKKEFDYLKSIYKIEPLEKHQWLFMRLRPNNFPTIRLAQFAQLIFQSEHLFSKIISLHNVKDVFSLFQFSINDFWRTHYTFSEKESKPTTKKMGNTFISLLIINTIIPTLFVYGKSIGDKTICDKAIHWLEEMPAEKNTIIEKYKLLDVDIKTAYDSQAILELKKNYCSKKNCLNCVIGFRLLKN
ncbi:MAG: DUF2851 family protein [Chitinophagaceae bacterium]|nr:DUF2851 family protein [Chitinophagaceae bacterium]